MKRVIMVLLLASDGKTGSRGTWTLVAEESPEMTALMAYWYG